ncbi:serine/threonine-protein kinase [Streptosporangium sp. NPDC004379]|uniref:serine/threonine-protein kinase n=1 Tax=Streptosporangium sp. NPDC004379 TaxID=3366189 RepID=UPI00369B67B1
MGTPDGEGLGPYRLLSTLGAGGFGEVHLALDPEGRTVAVKILHPHVAADATALARLAREVETMRRVQGPYVAEVLDASMAAPRPYLVTRYAQGRPLSAVIAAGAVEGDGLARLARGLAGALVAIHAAGVVHRDLKPANVILSDGEPVVIDFGIACALDSVSVTVSGAVLGTPGYLAPEVLEGADAGPAADLFSLGATLAHAATGRPPYGVGPASAVGYRVVHHDPDLEGVPGWLAPLLAACLRRDPSARPSASELLAALAAEPRVAALPARKAGAARPVRPLLAAVATAEPADDAGGSGGAGSAVAGPAAGIAEARAAEARAAEARAAETGIAFREPGDGAAGTGTGGVGGSGLHGLVTREWRPGRKRPPGRPSPEELRERRRAVLHRRWVIGTGLLTGLAAATARNPLPEVSLLLLSAYTLTVTVDAGVAMFARKNRGRAILDLGCVAGTLALWAVLGAFFSTLTLALALGTVVFVVAAILLGS